MTFCLMSPSFVFGGSDTESVHFGKRERETGVTSAVSFIQYTATSHFQETASVGFLSSAVSQCQSS